MLNELPKTLFDVTIVLLVNPMARIMATQAVVSVQMKVASRRPAIDRIRCIFQERQGAGYIRACLIWLATY